MASRSERAARIGGRATVTLWLATLGGFAGLWWWPFDLLSSFRVHYAAAFLVAAAFLLPARRWPAVAAAFVGFAINAAAVTSPAALAAPAKIEAGAATMRLVTLNVWFRNQDYDRVARYIESTAADIVVLQEVTPAQALDIRARVASLPYAFVDAARRPHGVAVLSRDPLLSAEAVQLVPDGVTVARIRIEMAGRPVTVIGAHLHWPLGTRLAARRDAELAALADLVASAPGPRLVVGDLNITIWSPWFARFRARSGLEDCAGGAVLPGSWPAWLGPASIRIDHCLRSADLASVATTRGPLVGSDHVAIVTDLAPGPRLARR
jgi:endonuclease/exonuclease/phosphatase (EEP) superfamily protein YafD